MKKDKVKELANKVWPAAKKEMDKVVSTAKKLINKGESFLKAVSETKELEKVVNSTKKLVDRGEEFLKVVSEKSVGGTKKISFNFKKRSYITVWVS